MWARGRDCILWVRLVLYEFAGSEEGDTCRGEVVTIRTFRLHRQVLLTVEVVT
jgi:hypothetical protein